MTHRVRLDGVERARSLRLDAARLALATVQRHASDLQDEMDGKAAGHARELAAIDAARRDRLDPRTHAASLEYLMHYADAQLQAQGRVSRAQEQVSIARSSCVQCDLQLALVQKLQAVALATRVCEGFRQQQKEADLTWLAASSRRGSRKGDIA
jgi:hypothetical protein